MILINDVYTADSVSTSFKKTEDANNAIPMIGPGLFPNRKKMGIELDMLRTHKGLHIQLAASNFDAMTTLRPRGTFNVGKTEMPFFRESMLIREHDLIELAKLADRNSPFLKDIMASIYDDMNELYQGALMIPEIMRMQLLAPEDGSPKVYINDNGVKYEYNYDVDGSYKTNNYTVLTGASKWDAPSTAKPFDDFRDAKRMLTKVGAVPRYALMNQKTFDLLAQIDSVRNIVLAQNLVANIDVDDATVNRVWQNKTGTQIVVYDKMYYDKATKTSKPYYPDGYVTLVPDGNLGYTWHGMTPEELASMSNANANVSIMDSGIAVVVDTDYKPPYSTTTTVSEIVLPSYERMDETYVIKVV